MNSYRTLLAMTIIIGMGAFATHGIFSTSGCGEPEPEDSNPTFMIRTPVGTVIQLPEDTWMSTRTGGDCLVRTEMSLVVSESDFEGPVILTVIAPVGFEPAGADCELASELISDQETIFVHQIIEAD